MRLSLVLGAFGGDEEKLFNDSVKDFETRTGIDVKYTSTNDLPTLIRSRVNGGNPPDLAYHTTAVSQMYDNNLCADMTAIPCWSVCLALPVRGHAAGTRASSPRSPWRHPPRPPSCPPCDRSTN